MISILFSLSPLELIHTILIIDQSLNKRGYRTLGGVLSLKGRIRYRSFAALLLVMLVFVTTLLSSVYAYPTGTISIVSYPYFVPMSLSGFNIKTHARWAGLMSGQEISVGFATDEPSYVYVGGGVPIGNQVWFSAACVSGCKANASSGEIDTIFYAAPQVAWPNSSSPYYLYPKEVSAYARLNACYGSVCTTLQATVPVSISVCKQGGKQCFGPA
jgi:hypothetical protein